MIRHDSKKYDSMLIIKTKVCITERKDELSSKIRFLKMCKI